MFLPTTISSENEEILERLEDTERKTKIRNCIHAIQVLAQNRNAIRRQELNKLAFPSTSYKVAAALLQAANKELSTVFGMRLFETPDKTKFLLVNRSPEFSAFQKHSSAACSEQAFLYFTLVGIFASPDERLTEEEVYNNVKPLELSKVEIKNFIDLFIKKLYLITEKTDDAKFYRWGSRAIAEVNPTEFFNRFLSLTGGTQAQDWPELCARLDKLKSIHARS